MPRDFTFSTGRARWGRATRLLGAVAAAGAFFAAASSAEAACYGATPSNAAYTDAIDGQSGLAPEITTVLAGVDSGCGYTVDPGVTRPLISGDAVFVHVDTDGNPATGDPLSSGGDIVIGTLGQTGVDGPPLRGVWDGATFRFTDPTPVGAPVGNGGFTAAVDRLGLAPGVTTRIVVGTIWSGTFSNYIDVAPNLGLGALPLPVNYSTVAPAPPAPVSKPVVKSPGTKRGAGSGRKCSVPGTRRLTVAKARTRLAKAGCGVSSGVTRRYAAGVRSGRVLGTTPGAGSRTSKPVRLVVSRGKRRARASAAGAGMLDRLNALAAQAQHEMAAE